VSAPGSTSTICGSVSTGAFADCWAPADNAATHNPGSNRNRAHAGNAEAAAPPTDGECRRADRDDASPRRRSRRSANAAHGSVVDDQSGASMTALALGADPLIVASGVAAQDLPAGALYVVATPIGNAADITLRALWVLSNVDAIAAEDTRTTGALLRRYGIDVPLLAAHEHNERAAAGVIVERLRAGRRVALVTDAGTPAISDPGVRIVRAALDAGLRVVPVPGASSLTAAASAAGLAGTVLTFTGFLPPAKRERGRLLCELAARGEAFALFEAPHRVAATAAELAAVLDDDRRVVIARELTKKFETLQVCRAGELAAAVAGPRGEYVLLVDAAGAAAADIDAVTRRWLAALAEVLPASQAAAIAAKASGVPRERLYGLLAGR
jgi:16S rRNA (cytidine1402-2'-O)-methyltransferase